MPKPFSAQGDCTAADARSVSDIRRCLQEADEEDFERLQRVLVNDTRKGVVSALSSCRRRLDSQKREYARLMEMYAFEREIAASHDGSLIVGLDEVGRGSLAGPLYVAAAVLDPACPIDGLNDSKKISPAKRVRLSSEIKGEALALSVVSVPSSDIDSFGISECLVRAFRKALGSIDLKLHGVETVLLDGNPLHLDKREISVVKGDERCASIAAASIVAKVARDSYMCDLDGIYPCYGFSSHKGYGTSAHINAIRSYGLTPQHRRSFCSGIIQDTLF